jgi:hypothetical protein
MTRAASIVSRSRISPMRITSGSWRSTYLRAFLNESVSAPTSRWFTMQFLCGWRYSIGSSTVRMWLCSSVLILSIIDASVVDLPEPVGPVTSTRPRGRFRQVLDDRRQPSSSKVRILNGIAERAGHRAALHEDVRAEAREVLHAEGEVELVLLLEVVLLRVGEDGVARAAWSPPGSAAAS